jgi:hypothetical protein
MKTDAGTAGAGTDFVGRGRRFDIQVLRDREIVRQEDIGPSLAAMVFESDSGSASFKSVRFEINP